MKAEGAWPAKLPEQDPEEWWAGLSFEERADFAFHIAGESLDRYETDHPDWPTETILLLLGEALEGLRHYLEEEVGPEEERVTWAAPFVVLHHTFPWTEDGGDGQEYQATTSFTRWTPETLSSLEAAQETALEAQALLIRSEALKIFVSTIGTYRTAEGRVTPLLPQQELEQLRGLPFEATAKRFAEDYRAATIGPYPLLKDDTFLVMAAESMSFTWPQEAVDLARTAMADKWAEEGETMTDQELRWEMTTHALSWHETQESATQIVEAMAAQQEPWRTFDLEAPGPGGKPVAVSVVAAFYPFQVVEGSGEQSFPVGVGLVFDPPADPTSWTTEERGLFWDSLLAAYAQAAGLDQYQAEPEPPAFEPRGATGWSDGKTRVDLETLQVAGGFAQLRRTDNWERVPRLEELEAAAIEKLQEELGEEAFRGRGAPLREVTVNRQTGETAFKLSSVKARELREECGLSTGGFRELDRTTGREYLVQCVETGGRLLETRISWWGAIEPLFASYRKDQLTKAQEAVREAEEQPSLFEDLTQERRSRANAWLARTRCYDLGVTLLHMALAQFGQERRNPVALLAQDLRRGLDLDGDSNWKSQVEGALDGLTALVVQLRSAEGYRGGGAMLSWWDYFPAGPGHHGQGTYLLHLSAPAIGRLRHFATGTTERLPYSKEEGLAIDATLYDWQREPSEEDVQEELGIGPKGRRSRRSRAQWYETYGGGLIHYGTSEGLSQNQQTLLRKLDSQETLKGSGVANGPDGRPWTRRSGSRAEDRNQPRIYTSAFCSLLPEGRRYHGALGNFPGRGSEQGRTLGGRGGKGWLEGLGYSLTRGRATKHNESVARQVLQDFQLVVVKLLDGVVAAKYRGDWITVEVAQKLPLAVLLSEVTWFLFPPEGWRAALRKRYETKHGVLVSQSPAAARAVREGILTGDTTLAPAGGAEGGQEQWPLYIRLQIAMEEQQLTQQAVAEFFGVSQSAVSRWLKGAEGRPIPQELRPMVEHWIATGEPPSREQLAARMNRRTGRRGS